MSKFEGDYLDLLRYVLSFGEDIPDRTGVGRRSIIGASLIHNLAHGFPALTTKRLYWRTAFKEMLWMLSGSTNIRPLLEQGVSIWTDWPLQKYNQQNPQNTLSQAEFEQNVLNSQSFANQWGDLGPVYGHQWRRWGNTINGYIDQIEQIISQIIKDPYSTRIILEGWNVTDLGKMALPPCHKTYQFFVRDNKLSSLLSQRSADIFLGVPFNICNQAFLTHLIARRTGLGVGCIYWDAGDVHLYQNHFEAAEEQLRREPYPLPNLEIKTFDDSSCDISEYPIHIFDLEGYECHPAIKADVAV